MKIIENNLIYQIDLLSYVHVTLIDFCKNQTKNYNLDYLSEIKKKEN